jgi:hypothetical protein
MTSKIVNLCELESVLCDNGKTHKGVTPLPVSLQNKPVFEHI